MWEELWLRMKKEFDTQVGKELYLQVVGCLFFDRYIIPAFLDPFGYCIIDYEPDYNLHEVSFDLARIISKIAARAMCPESSKRMGKYNLFIGEHFNVIENISAAFATGSLKGNAILERVNVPQGIKRASYSVFDKAYRKKFHVNNEDS